MNFPLGTSTSFPHLAVSDPTKPFVFSRTPPGFPWLGCGITLLAMDIDQARRKARALIAQATDAGVTIEEARSHALAAARLISKHELLAEVDGDDAGVASSAR